MCNCKIAGISGEQKMKKNSAMLSAAGGAILGGGVGVLINSVLPTSNTGGNTTALITNAAKIVGGVVLAASGKGSNKTLQLTAGLGLAGEGAAELLQIVMLDKGTTYNAPKLLGTPARQNTYYSSLPPNTVYEPLRMGAWGDGGVTDQMRY